jgi:hypothetical protein
MIEHPLLAEKWMKKHVITIIAVLLPAITCGATFRFALYRQFALVEVAASIAIGVQRFPQLIDRRRA